MRIEFAEETAPLPLPDQIAEADHQAITDSPEAMKILSEGIDAAQKGDRVEARHLLLRVTEQEPNNETAWLWLASISEYPEELLIFLNNVLDLNPKNERALKWVEETKTLLAKTFVQRGIEAEKEQNKVFAKQCFLQAIVHDSESDLAWMWLASVSDSDEEKVSHLRKVVNINPKNKKAQKSLTRARKRIAEANLNKAKSAFFDGDRAKAEKYLEECLRGVPNFENALLLQAELAETIDDKISTLEKVLELNPENQSALSAIETAKFDWILLSLSSAKSSIDEGKKDEANSLLDKVLKVSPDVIDAWLLKAETADSLDAKVSHLNQVLEIDSENEFAIQGLETHKTDRAMSLTADAKTAIAEKDVEKAKQLIDEALENAPDLEDALFTKCDLTEALDEKTELLHFILSSSPNNQKALEKLEEVEQEAIRQMVSDARGALDSGDMEKARELMLSATKLSSTNEDVLMLKCDITEPLDEKSSILDDLLSINPTNRQGLEARLAVNAELANESLASASAAASAGNKQNALDLLDQAFAYVPDLEAGWLLKGYMSDSFDTKIQCFEKVLSANPENEAAKANLLSLKSFVKTASSVESVEKEHQVVEKIASDEDAVKEVEESPSEIEHEEVTEVAEAPEHNGEEVVEFNEIVTETFGLDAASPGEQMPPASAPDIEVGVFNEPELASDQPDIEENAEQEEAFFSKDLAPISMPESPDDFDLESEEHFELESSEADDSLIEVSSKTPDEFASEMENAENGVKTILVVDDSATIRKLISGKLEKSGHETICAVDGIDALDRLEELVPDLVLLDIAMPRMDGYQVCKMIRENEATENVPVIMVSGKDGFFDKALGKLAGSSSYISKPFGPEALMKIVNEHLI